MDLQHCLQQASYEPADIARQKCFHCKADIALYSLSLRFARPVRKGRNFEQCVKQTRLLRTEFHESISSIQWSASVTTFLQSSQHFIRESCSHLLVQFIFFFPRTFFLAQGLVGAVLLSNSLLGVPRSSSNRWPRQHSTYPAFTCKARDVASKWNCYFILQLFD